MAFIQRPRSAAAGDRDPARISLRRSLDVGPAAERQRVRHSDDGSFDASNGRIVFDFNEAYRGYTKNELHELGHTVGFRVAFHQHAKYFGLEGPSKARSRVTFEASPRHPSFCRGQTIVYAIHEHSR